MFIDLVLLVMPLPIVLKLQMTSKKRFGLILMFGLGGLYVLSLSLDLFGLGCRSWLISYGCVQVTSYEYIATGGYGADVDAGRPDISVGWGGSLDVCDLFSSFVRTLECPLLTWLLVR